MRDLANGLRKLTPLDLARRLVAGRVASEHGDRRVEVLVVAEREERDARGGILDADAAAGEGGEAHLADPDAGRDVGRRGAKHDELGAAVIDEVMERQHADARRLEPDLEVAGDARLDCAQSVEDRAGRA